ncbi:hypothetical protein MSS88_03125 [bacterium]|nr:hypothetical protein [bacterium]MDY2598734.1 hypothetical protein [Lachnospiraceae bacterium]
MKKVKKSLLSLFIATATMFALALPTFAAGYGNDAKADPLWETISHSPTANIAVETPITVPDSVNRSSYTSTVDISRNSNLMSAWRNFDGSDYTCAFTSVRWRDPTLDDEATANGSLTVKIGKKFLGSFSELDSRTQSFSGKNNVVNRPNFSVSFSGIGSGERGFSFSTRNVAFSSSITMRN